MKSCPYRSDCRWKILGSVVCLFFFYTGNWKVKPFHDAFLHFLFACFWILFPLVWSACFCLLRLPKAYSLNHNPYMNCLLSRISVPNRCWGASIKSQFHTKQVLNFSKCSELHGKCLWVYFLFQIKNFFVESIFTFQKAWEITKLVNEIQRSRDRAHVNSKTGGRSFLIILSSCHLGVATSEKLSAFTDINEVGIREDCQAWAAPKDLKQLQPPPVQGAVKWAFRSVQGMPQCSSKLWGPVENCSTVEYVGGILTIQFCLVPATKVLATSSGFNYSVCLIFISTLN